MTNLGFSACSLSVFLAAVAGQAPCAKAVLIEKELLASNQVDVFGRTHNAVGNADLSLTLGGTLVVSNIGSSGLDGVTVRLGDTRGLSMSMDMGDLSALAPGAKVEMFLPYRFGEQTIFIQEQGGGSARLGVGGSYPPPQRLTVTILDNGVPVDSRCVDPSAFPSLVTGDMGSDPISGQGLSLSFEQVEWDYVATLTLPADSPLTIPGSPAGAVTGDQVRVSMEGLPPGEAPSGDIRVMCTDLAQDLEIRSEDLILPGVSRLSLPGVTNATYDINVGKRVTALGGSHVEGMAEADACRSNPKVWFFSTRLLDTTRAITVDNLGSSGQDGVRISYGDTTPCGPGFFQCPDGSCVADPAYCPSVATDRVVHIGGKDPATPDYLDLDSDDDGITFSATGTSGGSSGVDFGHMTLTNEVGGGNELTLDADFSSIGSDLMQIAVYLDGQIVGVFDHFRQPGNPIGQITPSAAGIDITSCGKFVGGPPFGPPCFFFTTADTFTLIGGGQVFVGNECRVLAAGNPTPIDFIDTFDITGTNLEPFDLRLESDVDAWPATGVATVAQGTRMYAAGSSSVSTGADDSLVVSNIGSSGLDGVRIPIGDASGAGFDLTAGGEFTVDSFFDIAYSIAPDCCGNDPDDLCYVKMRLQATTPDRVTVTGSATDPTALLTVTPRDRFGNPLGSFTMDQTQSIAAADPSGVGLQISGYHAFLRVDTGGTLVECAVCHLIADPGGGGSGGVLITSPAGVSFQEVFSVEISVSTPAPAGVDHHGHVTVLKSHDPGGGSGTPGDMEIASFSKKGYDHYMASSGQARTQIEVCDSSTGTDVFHSVANIGSSGQDGVRFDLSPETCRLNTACCIDNDCDDDIDDIWLNVNSLDGNGVGDLKVKIVAKRSPASGGGSISYVGTCDASDPATGGGGGVGVVVSDEGGAVYVYGATVQLFDPAGTLLASHTYQPGGFEASRMATRDSSSTDGRFQWSMAQEMDPADGRIRQRPDLLIAEWDEIAPVTLPTNGTLYQNVARCEIQILPTQGTPMYFEEAASLDVLLAAPAGELGSCEITDFGLSRFPPPCPADVNGDGVIDNGDIGNFIALFLAQDPRVDFTGDGVIDNGDIGAFIAAFLAGC